MLKSAKYMNEVFKDNSLNDRYKVNIMLFVFYDVQAYTIIFSMIYEQITIQILSVLEVLESSL